MTLPDLATVLGLALGAVALVGANVALLRLARPDRGTRPIAGCCGMVLPAEIAGGVENGS